MIQLTNHGVYLVDGKPVAAGKEEAEQAKKKTLAWRILQAHNVSGDEKRRLSVKDLVDEFKKKRGSGYTPDNGLLT